MPPIGGVQDPATRAALQALSDNLNVRNGHTGTGEARFLTEADLRAMGVLKQSDLGISVAGGGRTSGAPGGGTVGVPRVGQIPNLLNQLSARIMQSPLFIDLGTNISALKIDMAFVKTQTNDIITGFGSKVTEVINATNVLVRWDSQQFAQMQNNLAIAHSWVTTNANKFSTYVNKVDAIQASVGDPTNPANPNGSLYSRLAQESVVRANKDGELYGQYTVKVDVGGYVTGFGLAGTRDINGNLSSEFYIRADCFAVASPTGSPAASRVSAEVMYDEDGNVIYDPDTNNPRYKLVGIQANDPNIPFIVRTESWIDNDGKMQPPGAYIRSAFIEYAGIDTANIRNAAVDTLKIRGQAVTFPYGGTDPWDRQLGNDWVYTFFVPFTNNDAGYVPQFMTGNLHFKPGSGGGGNKVGIQVEVKQIRPNLPSIDRIVFQEEFGYPNNIDGPISFPIAAIFQAAPGDNEIYIRAREYGPDIRSYGTSLFTTAFTISLKR